MGSAIGCGCWWPRSCKSTRDFLAMIDAVLEQPPPRLPA